MNVVIQENPKKTVVTVRLDNGEQVVEFFSKFQESVVSNYFAFACLPPGKPDDSDTKSIFAFLTPMGEDARVDRQFMGVLEHSLREGMLAEWQSEGRVTIPSDSASHADSARETPLEEIERELDEEKRLEPEPFRIDSTGWETTVTPNDRYSLKDQRFPQFAHVLKTVNPDGDVIELSEGPLRGHQLFTHAAAIRETAKAGKRMFSMDDWRTFIRKSEPDVEFRPKWQDQAYLVRRLGLFSAAKESESWLTLHSCEADSENGKRLGIALTYVRVQPRAEYEKDEFGLVFCHKE